jgi:lipid-binding SYLF domain-containing protein
MFEKAPKLKAKFNKAHAYAIYPEIKKAGIGIGGAGGKGVVYKGGAVTGQSKMSQASIGFQLGAQKYSELILFENLEAYEKFTGGKLKFNADVNAVALDADAVGFDLPYSSGVLIFTMGQGGVMFSASVAGQKFTFE